jgi:hypothetical protein
MQDMVRGRFEISREFRFKVCLNPQELSRQVELELWGSGLAPQGLMG